MIYLIQLEITDYYHFFNRFSYKKYLNSYEANFCYNLGFKSDFKN